MSEEDPTAIFHRLYDAAAAGGEHVPWDRGGPHPLLDEWARAIDGGGRRALVIGSGLGEDAELLARRGFDVAAFDISPVAIAMTRARFPGSPVDYRVADLFDLPAAWEAGFDLVVESLTVQSLPPALHAAAIAAVARTVAPGGTLVVVAHRRDDDDDDAGDGPPWPLTRSEVESFADGGLERVDVEGIPLEDGGERWRAEFRRPRAPS